MHSMIRTIRNQRTQPLPAGRALREMPPLALWRVAWPRARGSQAPRSATSDAL